MPPRGPRQEKSRLSQGVIAAQGGGDQLFLQHSRLAALVLRQVPWLYDPEPEIFVERSRHVECGGGSEQFPVAFFTDDGIATKVLVDGKSLDRLAQRFRVDPGYLEMVKQKYSGREGWFYLDPPRGAIVARPDAAQ